MAAVGAAAAAIVSTAAIVSEDNAACAAAMSSAPVHFVSANGRSALPSAVWARLAPCFNTLRGAVYIYSEAELGMKDFFPLTRQPLRSWLASFNQYSADQHLIHLLYNSDMLTSDPSAARLFIIPQFATHETHFCAFHLSDPSVGTELGSCANYVCGHYLQHIRDAVSASPWFKRHGGADHMLVFPWDLGHLLFRGTYSNNSLKILPVRPSCDIVDWVRQSRVLLAQYLYTVPQSAAQEPAAVMRNVLMQGQPQGAAWPGDSDLSPSDPNERVGPPNGGCAVAPTRWLATFRGTVWDGREYSGGIRQDLLAYYTEANRSTDGILFSKGHTSPEEYAAELRDSLFCLSPPGVVSAGVLPRCRRMPIGAL